MLKKTKINFKKYSKNEIDLNLERLKIALNLLGNPEGKLKFIHVAGTNGKGSVCAMLSCVLKNSGYKTFIFYLKKCS